MLSKSADDRLEGGLEGQPGAMQAYPGGALGRAVRVGDLAEATVLEVVEFERTPVLRRQL